MLVGNGESTIIEINDLNDNNANNANSDINENTINY